MGKNFNGTQINNSETIVEQAGADIADVRNRAVKYDKDGNVVLTAASTDAAIGLAIIEAGYNDISGETSGKAATGDDVDIQIKDIGYAIASDTIKKGAEVSGTADGLIKASAAGDYVLGIALTAGTKGSYVEVLINRYQKASA